MFPITLNLGFTKLEFYEGIYFVLSILLGYILGMRRLKKNGLYNTYVESAIFWSVMAAIIGARVSHFVFWNWEIFLNDPSVFFRVWEGGASVTGGLILAFAAAYVYCKINKLNFFQIFAVLSPVILLSQAFGRIGCFLNGDAFGAATKLFWGIRMPKYSLELFSFKPNLHRTSPAWDWSLSNKLIESTSMVSAKVHPTQLYEAAADLVLMALVLFMFSKIKEQNKPRYAVIFFMHTGGYALIRFLLEFIRSDHPPVLFIGLSMLQIFLLLWALLCITGIVLFRPSEKSVPLKKRKN